MHRLGLIGAILGGLTACMGGGGGGGTVAPATCGEAECADICASGTPDAGSGPHMSEFEKGIVDPILVDIREGVRPWDPQGIGVCKGKRECDEFLGTDVGSLPAGEYLLKADLRVPRTGDAHTWTVEVTTDCETVKTTESGETKSTSSNTRSYDVRYAGEDRGYRLMPLRTITSPSDGGARNCKYTIKAPHPDGEKTYTGSWSTPDAGT